MLTAQNGISYLQRRMIRTVLRTVVKTCTALSVGVIQPVSVSVEPNRRDTENTRLVKVHENIV